MFRNCKALKRLIFLKHPSLMTIEAWCFKNSGLTEIFIPAWVRRIGDGAFYKCERLEVIRFSENSELKTVGDHALAGTRLSRQSVQFPPNAVISPKAFVLCANDT